MATVLVVDDERCIRLTLRLFLKADGHDVLVAATAQEAKTMLAESPVDVVLIDIMLGRDSGLDVAEYIHDHYPGIQFSLMTGGPCAASANEAARLQAFGYLAKPLSRADICDEVRRAVANRQATESGTE